jgi:hypothetical protein
VDALLRELAQHGWDVAPPEPGQALPARYGSLPDALQAWLASFARCANPEGTAWFVAMADVIRDAAGLTPEDAFRHDEFERLSLEAAGDDAPWARAIRDFWQRHFPLWLRVDGDYEYCALVLDGPGRGTVVHAVAPDFEATSTIAASLPDFLAQVRAALATPAPPSPYAMFRSDDA